MAKDFDPTEKSVDEVNKYLEKADAEERERVLSAELSGKKRKTILEPAGIDADERRDASGRVLNPWEVSPEDQVNVSDDGGESAGAPEPKAAEIPNEQGGGTPAGSGSAAGGTAGTGAGLTAPGTAATTSAGAPPAGGTTGAGTV